MKTMKKLLSDEMSETVGGLSKNQKCLLLGAGLTFGLLLAPLAITGLGIAMGGAYGGVSNDCF